jgi:peptidoglycan/LPS O-acetylase OafA/YrhL
VEAGGRFHLSQLAAVPSQPQRAEVDRPVTVPARIRQLDAVRGIAILVVIFHNQSTKYPSLHLQGIFANGWMGVDLFFVLSGFLITGILIDTKSSEGYFRNFYARRCLRIWPLYYAAIAFMLVAVPLLQPSTAEEIYTRSSPWWSYPIFLQNFLVQSPTHATGLLAVTWSLAVEEQFYLVWPWIVWFASEAQLRRFAVAVIVLSAPLRYWLLSSFGVDLYQNTFCRLDGLMAGAFLAMLARSATLNPEKFIPRAWILLGVAGPLAFALEAMGMRWLVYSCSAMASAAFVYLAIFENRRWFRAALTSRFLVYTGTISYGLYLLHKIPFDVEDALHLDRYPALVFAAGLAASYALAALSWRIFEKPILELKRFFESRRAALPGRPFDAAQTARP